MNDYYLLNQVSVFTSGGFPVNFDFGPGKSVGLGVVDGDEIIDGLPPLRRTGETRSLQRRRTEHAEPHFHLIEPGGVGRGEVQLDARMGPQPGIVLGLVGGEVVQDDMQITRRMGRHDLAHEVQKLDPAAARIMVGLHLAGRAGARVKELVCRGTVRQLALEARRPGRVSLPRWAGDPRRRMLLASGRGDARRTPATQEGVR